MPIRLVAIDLDGTLLDGRSEISSANKQALVETALRGVQLVVVTGRRFHSARPIIQQIPCPITLIASNGALIGSSSGEILYRNFLPRRIARSILEAGSEYRPYAVAIFDVATPGQITMQEGASPEGPLSWYGKKSLDVLAIVQDLCSSLTSDPIQLMFGGPPPIVEPIEPLLRYSTAGSFVHLTWTKYLTRNLSILDVMNRGCSKGATLALWTDQRGIRPIEVMAIGDNFNDLEMLEFSGFPVLMGNCSLGLGRDGWPVTLSNEQDGVAAALESYVLR